MEIEVLTPREAAVKWYTEFKNKSENDKRQEDRLDEGLEEEKYE